MLAEIKYIPASKLKLVPGQKILISKSLITPKVSVPVRASKSSSAVQFGGAKQIKIGVNTPPAVSSKVAGTKSVEKLTGSKLSAPTAPQSSNARKRKFSSNEVLPVLAEKFKQAIVATGDTGPSPATSSPEVDTALLVKIERNTRKTREDVILMKKFLLGQNKQLDEWQQIKDKFPFDLPLANYDDVESCENYLCNPENEETLVSFLCQLKSQDA